MSAAPLAEFRVQEIRRDFPILATRLHASETSPGVPLAYLDNAASTQRPRQVIDAISSVYEKHYANVHRGIHWLSDQSTDLFEQAREKVRAFINAGDSSEIIFTRGTTESINLVAQSWGGANLRPGDEILLSVMEHHANIVPWQMIAERTGAVLKYIPISDDGQLDMPALEQLLTARTRLVAIASISNVLGTINPVAEIVRKAKAQGAVTLIDAAQSVPHQPTDVAALDCDFLAFSGHKMLGPTGIGVLYGRKELLEKMPPFLGGGSMIRRVRLDGFEPADVPARFEAGTPPIAPAIALGAAIDYLSAIGFAAIVQQERLLANRAHELLTQLGGVRFLGPAPDKKCGIVSFILEGIHAHDIAQILDRHGVAIRAGHHCAMPLHQRLGINASSRASFYFYNTLAEVDALAEGLSDVKRTFARRKPAATPRQSS